MLQTIRFEDELKTRLDGEKSPQQVIAQQEVKPKYCRFEKYMVEYNIERYEVLGKNLTHEQDGSGLLLYREFNMIR